MKIIMIYGQIQSGPGTKDDTMVPLTGEREPIGPTVTMESFLKQVDGHVAACLYRGNGTSLVDPERASRKFCATVNKLQLSVAMCGPAFNFADYTGACAEVACDINATTKAKTFATMSVESEDTIVACKDEVAVMKTLKKGGMGLNDALKNMCTLVKALADGSDTAELEYGFCFRQRRIYRIRGMITTWRMTVEGITEGAQVLKSDGGAGDAIESTIREVEDFPYHKSVGYDGLPNEEMEVKVDAAFMDGNTLGIGAVATIRDSANPISIAKYLSHEKVDSLLVTEGAEKFTHKEGFEHKNMLTDRAKARYRKCIKEISVQAAIQAISQELKPCSGHDAVDVACLDMTGKMIAVTSTSGPSVKKKGGVGDSSISGSGFYADSKRGAAGVTGLGEDLMKSCIPYEIVRPMGEGTHPQGAYETAISRLGAELREHRGEAGNSSLTAMNPKDGWGVVTSIESSSFTVVTEPQEPAVYLMTRQEDGRCTYEQASDERMENCMKTRMVSIEE